MEGGKRERGRVMEARGKGGGSESMCMDMMMMMMNRDIGMIEWKSRKVSERGFESLELT